jgi:predicted RNase H-like nuclease
MLTLGIDFAAQPKNTATCTIEWKDQRAELIDLICDVDDAALLQMIPKVDKVGIDIPLGWPVSFVKAITAHTQGAPWPESSTHEMRFRKTDCVVRERTDHWPLSVSTDLISIAAMRAARLLGSLGKPVLRCGTGCIAEVYPAAALRIWGFDPTGYKGKKGKEKRHKLLQDLLARIDAWFSISDLGLELCKNADHALDAFVAALIARASVCGLIEEIPEDLTELAAIEGWIALPRPGSLEALARRGPPSRKLYPGC